MKIQGQSSSWCCKPSSWRTQPFRRNFCHRACLTCLPAPRENVNASPLSRYGTWSILKSLSVDWCVCQFFSKVLVIGIIYWLVASCRLMGGWIPSSWDIGTGPNRPASRTPTIRQDFWSGFICHISALETHAVHVWLWFWSFFTPKPDGFMAKIEHFYALHNSHTLMRYASTI